MKIKARNKLAARAFLPRDRMRPIFRFNDGVFAYELTPEQREILNVPKDNPGVIVIVTE